ncbi:DsrE family protein [Paenibacillus sp.]|jgi:intracellular sulfur oxidation DsrE/DsrF family protein|uniref:DsrE family protein n=1 Tax=Paenibacillus sp. TaxID=58172 RepID=UPI0028349FE0|nr:DsrE family protein [Paenibacillus sp.]MDR0267322.1 transcriptional regulator [Paenibacillus sp.]
MQNKVIFLTTDSMGNGERELGTQILETFFTLLKQREQLPAAIFCANRGVFALTEQSLVSVHLQEIADKGVPVLACATCVDYYDVRDQLTSGEISSMGQFMELAAKYEVMTLA